MEAGARTWPVRPVLARRVNERAWEERLFLRRGNMLELRSTIRKF